jgi:hypothetical protein
MLRARRLQVREQVAEQPRDQDLARNVHDRQIKRPLKKMPKCNFYDIKLDPITVCTTDQFES